MKKERRKKAGDFLFVAAFVLALTHPLNAFAMNRPTRTILTMSGYGIVGGTVLGLASYPISRNPRTIFMGSSIGLYLGLALGLYYASNDYTPETPPGFGNESRSQPEIKTPTLAREPQIEVGLVGFEF